MACMSKEIFNKTPLFSGFFSLSLPDFHPTRKLVLAFLVSHNSYPVVTFYYG